MSDNNEWIAVHGFIFAFNEGSHDAVSAASMSEISQKPADRLIKL